MCIIFCNGLSSLSYHLNFTLTSTASSSSLAYLYHIHHFFPFIISISHSSQRHPLFVSPTFTTFIFSSISSQLYLHLSAIVSSSHHITFIFSFIISVSYSSQRLSYCLTILSDHSSSFLFIIISISPSSQRHLLVSPNHHTAFILFILSSQYPFHLKLIIFSPHLTLIISISSSPQHYHLVSPNYRTTFIFLSHYHLNFTFTSTLIILSPLLIPHSSSLPLFILSISLSPHRHLRLPSISVSSSPQRHLLLASPQQPVRGLRDEEDGTDEGEEDDAANEGGGLPGEEPG